MPTRVKWIGGDELERSLKAAGADLADLRALHAKVGEELAIGGRQKVPVDTGSLEGTIRSSGTKTASVVRAGGPSVPYAGVQEFGWPARNIDAQPYLTQALEDQEPQISQLYLDEIDRILAQVHGAPPGAGGLL